MPRPKKVIPHPEIIQLAAVGKVRGRIILCLIRPLPEGVSPALSAQLQKAFDVPVEYLDLAPDISFAFNRKRNQYSSPKILDKLRKIAKNPDDKILGIVDVDLFCPDYDFVFGEADSAAGVATLSIYRLEQGTKDAKLISERIIKEAIHETGHLFNLGHCDDPKCVMSFSTGYLRRIDAKSASICPECRSVSPQSGTIQN